MDPKTQADETQDDVLLKEGGTVDKKDDIDIEVIDDTPPQDRGRAPMKTPVEDPNDEELAEYSEKVQRRIKEMARARHDERRRAEAAERERQEALRAAQVLLDENRKLKKYVHTGETAYATTAAAAAEAEIESAKVALKKAHEDFDTDAIVAAQERLTEAKLRLREAKAFKPTPLQDEGEGVEDPSRAAPAPKADPKAEAWLRDNQWFGTDEEMTALALAAHKKLVDSGVDPRSDTYYEQINARMRKRFPEYFEGEETADDTPPNPKPKQEKPVSVVAPVTRSQAPKKVRLTQSQVNIASRLGLTPEQYARELAKLGG